MEKNEAKRSKGKFCKMLANVFTKEISFLRPDRSSIKSDNRAADFSI